MSKLTHPFNMRPKCIAVTGLPGSGKTTFSTKLGKMLNIPVHHLDRYLFMPGDIKRSKDEYRSSQKELVKGQSWIIEGCATSSLEIRYSKACIVIYFRLPRLLCIWRIFKRFLFEKNDHPDTPEGCSKVFTWELIRYIWTFDKKKRPGFEEIKKKYPEVVYHIVTTQKESNHLLESFRLI